MNKKKFCDLKKNRVGQLYIYIYIYILISWSCYLGGGEGVMERDWQMKKDFNKIAWGLFYSSFFYTFNKRTLGIKKKLISIEANSVEIKTKSYLAPGSETCYGIHRFT